MLRRGFHTGALVVRRICRRWLVGGLQIRALLRWCFHIQSIGMRMSAIASPYLAGKVLVRITLLGVTTNSTS